MSDEHLHLDDHRKILNALDCSQEVAALDKDISLIQLRLQEAKEDKEKNGKNLMWVSGMLFSIVMAVAGFGIQSNATIQVLQEKVKEQKMEIEKLTIYVQDVENSLETQVDQVYNDLLDTLSDK